MLLSPQPMLAYKEVISLSLNRSHTLSHNLSPNLSPYPMFRPFVTLRFPGFPYICHRYTCHRYTCHRYTCLLHFFHLYSTSRV